MLKLFSKTFKFISHIVLPKVIVVGVDIQNEHISFYANYRKRKTGKDNVSGTEVIPVGSIQDGEIKDPKSLFEVLEKLMNKVSVTRLKDEAVVVLSLPPTHMYTEFVTFPLMSQESLEEAVNLKITTSIPWPVEEAYVDWKIRTIGDPRKIGVFIAALHRPLLDQYLNLFIKGGWRVAASEFHLLSLSQAGKFETHGPFIFVLIDEDGVEFAVFNGSEICSHFVKKFDNAAELSKNISFEARRLAAYAETELGLKIGNFYLFDKAGMQAPIDQLGKDLEAPVKAFSPSENPETYIALGASMRSFNMPERTINFVPHGYGGRYQENLIIQTLRLWTNMATVAGLVAILTLSGFYVFLKGQNLAISKEVRTLVPQEQQVAKNADLIEAAKQFNLLASAATQAAGLKTRHSDWAKFITEAAKKNSIEVLSIRRDTRSPAYVTTVFASKRDNLLAFQKQLENGLEASIIPPPSSVIETTLTKVEIGETPTGWINIRSGPDQTFQMVARASSSESFDLVEEKGTWYKIKYSDEIDGWVTSQYAKKVITKIETPATSTPPVVTPAATSTMQFLAVNLPVTELAKEADITVTLDLTPKLIQ